MSEVIDAIVKRFQDKGFTVHVAPGVLLIRKTIGDKKIGLEWAIDAFEIDQRIDPNTFLDEAVDEQIQKLELAIAELPPMSGLTVGQIVHYVNEANGTHLAAIIMQVIDPVSGEVSLMIFDAGNLAEAMGKMTRPRRNIFYSEEKERGTWHWIEEE